MLKKFFFAFILTLLPLFAAVSYVKAVKYVAVFDLSPLLTLVNQNLNKESATSGSRANAQSSTPYHEIQLPSYPQNNVLGYTGESTPKTPSPSLSPVPNTTPSPIPSPTPSSTPEVITTTFTTQPVAATSDTNSVKNHIMSEINAYRKASNLPEFTEDNFTCEFAKVRAKELKANFSHEGFNRRFGSASLPYPSLSKAAENIATTPSFTVVFYLWKKSPAHNKNLLSNSPYGCVANSGNYYAFESWTP